MDTLTEGLVKQDGICQNSCDNGFVADDSANCVGMLWLQYIPMLLTYWKYLCQTLH